MIIWRHSVPGDNRPVGQKRRQWSNDCVIWGPRGGADLQSGRWSEEVDREEQPADRCVTLPERSEDVEELPGEQGCQDSTPQERFMAEELQEFLGTTVTGIFNEGEEVTTVPSPGGGNPSAGALQQEVQVEVHQEHGQDVDVSVSGTSRKRPAGTAEVEEVLTQGQHPGKKAWVAEELKEVWVGPVTQELHGRQAQESDGDQVKTCEAPGCRTGKVAMSKPQRHRGKPPLI